ncbi:MAG: arylesterase [Acidobacteria bacterium]|nr:MAG: arylesterase [Acidobacteriota bacterium]
MRFSPRVGALSLVSLAFGATLACHAPESRSDAADAGRATAGATAPAKAGSAIASDSGEAATAAPLSATSSATTRTGKPRIVALVDSLTAGLGLAPDQAFPAVLQRRLDDEGLTYEVVNAGVSGDTSAGGLRRLDWSLEGDVRILIVALGGNDALRGLPVEELRSNLSSIISQAQARGIRVILAGMEAPPNYGPVYARSFHQVFPDLAKQYQVALLPFLLQGVAGVAPLNQSDGIHPTVEGARMVADNVWTVLQPMVKRS